MNGELLLPPGEQEPQPQEEKPVLPATPSPQQQSWGVVISIVVIVLMVVIGAFYAWGERIAAERALSESINQY